MSDFSFGVIYEDNHLLVLDKPPGLLTQPSGTNLESLEEQAKQWVKVSHGKPGNVFLHAVHRLDRAAMGIVLFAKTSKALARLSESIRKRLVKKYYQAWVEGIWREKKKEGIVEGYVLHEAHRARVVSKGVSGGQSARLQYRVIKEVLGKNGEPLTLLEIDLETGRYHQIRAQLAHEGYPILGDVKYGAKKWESEGIALCHFRMEVPHPVTGEVCVFLSNLL